MLRHVTRAIRRRPRILCYVVHYYGRTSGYVGKSSTSSGDSRRAVLTRALEALRALPYDIDVKVCGDPEASLLPIDINLSAVNDPRHFTFASIENLVLSRAGYDYFLCLEDDILVTPDVIERMIRFERDAEVNEVLLPNRLELVAPGLTYCVDLLAIPGWRGLRREFEGLRLDIAKNPHSGLAFLSRRQLEYGLGRVDLTRREEIVGEYMPSALANLHEPFMLWRTRDDEAAHHVTHLDRWTSSSPRISLRGRTIGRAPSEALGFIDLIVLDGVMCTVEGWAIGADRSSVDRAVSLNGIPVLGARLETTYRPDVQRVHEGVEETCGFRAVFSLLDLQTNDLTASTVTVSVADVELTAEWPTALALRAVQQAPEVPETPFMPTLLVNRIRELLAGATCYLEYGTGGTTVLAARLGVPLSYCVESDPSWLSAVEHKTSRIDSRRRLILLHADIGPVDARGYPGQLQGTAVGDYVLDVWRRLRADDASPDVILIDGRFRVACFLASLLHARPGTRIVFEDYRNRPFYQSVERIVAPNVFHDRAAEFVVPDRVPRDSAWSLLAQHAADAR